MFGPQARLKLEGQVGDLHFETVAEAYGWVDFGFEPLRQQDARSQSELEVLTNIVDKALLDEQAVLLSVLAVLAADVGDAAERFEAWT